MLASTRSCNNHIIIVQAPAAALMAAAAVASELDGLRLTGPTVSSDDLELHALMDTLMCR